MTDYPAGTYMAQLILSDNPYEDMKLFKEITHLITIHSDGKITESRYFSALTAEWTEFSPPRVWSRHVLNSHHLMMV
jgi:hypothetical protein